MITKKSEEVEEIFFYKFLLLLTLFILFAVLKTIVRVLLFFFYQINSFGKVFGFCKIYCDSGVDSLNRLKRKKHENKDKSSLYFACSPMIQIFVPFFFSLSFSSSSTPDFCLLIIWLNNNGY